MEEKRYCLECGDVLRGRADQKFCSDICRTAYHNRKHSAKNAVIRRVNSILRKNRNILEKLNPGGKTKVSKEKLTTEGFNFSYITNIYTTKTGNTYFYCYDQGYLPIEGDNFILVRKKEYIDN
jgi:predicted nucleic acid-binding Zn ribbon protein